MTSSADGRAWRAFRAARPGAQARDGRRDTFEGGAGTVLIREGDAGDRFYVILDGEVSVSRGNRHVLDQGAGGYIGEIALLRDVPRTATVVAKTPVTLLSLEREPLLLAVTEHPQSREAAHAVAEARSR